MSGSGDAVQHARGPPCAASPPGPPRSPPRGPRPHSPLARQVPSILLALYSRCGAIFAARQGATSKSRWWVGGAEDLGHVVKQKKNGSTLSTYPNNEATPKPYFPAPGPQTLFSGPWALQNKSGTCLNASGVFVASNLHVEMGKTII